MGGRWSVVVEPEYEEEFPDSPGCHIAFRRLADRRPYEEAARQAGYRLGEVELVVPVEGGGSVYFNSLGRCDGISWGDATSDPEQPVVN